MEISARLILSCFTLACLQQVCTGAAVGHKISDRTIVKRSMVPLPDGLEYSDLQTCERVTCPQDNLNSCELKEVIIWKTGNNRFCRYCEYCLDWPWAAARARRSVARLADGGLSEGRRRLNGGQLVRLSKRSALPGKANIEPDQVFNTLCPYVQCPVPPPNDTCEHTEEVLGFIRGRRCLSCATCIQQTITPPGSNGQYYSHQ